MFKQKRPPGVEGVYDLPDCAYYAMFEDGLLPNDAAEQALKEAGFRR